MSIELGWAEGKCPECGQTLRRKRPIDVGVCDCWEYCPNGHRMQPYVPDSTPSTYSPIESPSATGDLKNPMKIVMLCPICHYYSALLPVEVALR